MSIIERAQKAINECGKGENFDWHKKQNELARKFYNGEIDLDSLRRGLSQRKRGNEIILPWPGPLYGFLRKIGIDKEKAKRIVEEERGHYQVAREKGLETKIVVEILSGGSFGNVRGCQIRVSLAYLIPEGIDEDRLREAIRDISLAVERPSPDDLEMIS